MNFRLTAVLFAVVTLLLVGLLVAVLTDTRSDDDQLATDTIAAPLVGVRESDIDGVELVRTEPGEQRLVFTKAGTIWSQTEPFPAKLDQAEVAGLVRDLYRAKPVAYNGPGAGNLSLSGLDPATVRVTLKGKGQALTVNVGKTLIGGTRALTFVATSARPDRVLALNRGDLLGVFRAGAADSDGPAYKLVKWLPDYRVKKLFGADLRDPALESTAIKVKTGGKELALARGASTGWAFTAPANLGPVDDAGDPATQAPNAPLTGVRPLLNAVAGVALGSADDVVENPGDLKPLGLAPDDPTAVRVELTTPTGVDAATFGKPVLGPDNKPVVPAKVYAKLDGEAGVLKVAFDRLDALRATVNSPQEMRNKDLIAPAQRDKLDAIDLTAGGQTIKLRRVPVVGAAGPEPKWVIYGGPAGPVFAKAEPVTRLIDALTRPRAGREVLATQDNAAVMGTEVKATIKAWAGAVTAPADPKASPGQIPAEPDVKAPALADLVLGKRDAALVFARLTAAGRSTDYKFPDTVLTLASTPRLDWVDPRFASFNLAKVNRLTFNRGAEAFDLEKAGDNWVFASPANMKGRPADGAKVGAVLDQLATLTAERVLSEQPSPDDLKKVALDPAAVRMKVTVAVQDDVNKTRAYEFGTDTEDGKGIHVRQAGVPALVRADRRAFDTLAGADLRDPVVVRVDPAKVTKLRLRGWKGLIGPDPLVYQLEKRGTEWASTTPNTNPATAKVNALIAAVSAPRAESFVGPNTPAHGTTVEANDLAVEVTLEQPGSPPVTLTLGNAADAGRVFATSSALPGETFLFNPTAVRPLVAKPTSFQK